MSHASEELRRHRRALAGFQLRIEQVKRWSARLSNRLEKVQKLAQPATPRKSPSLYSPSTIQLLQKADEILREGHDFVGRAEQNLADAFEFLDSAETAPLSPAAAMEMSQSDCIENAKLKTKDVAGHLVLAAFNYSDIDWRILPVTWARTKSDPCYEGVIERLLGELNLGRFAPVVTHMSAGPMSVDMSFEDYPIFFFPQADRSLHGITLLLHEIGHHVFKWCLTKQHRRAIDSEIKKYAQEGQDKPIVNAIHEIAADTFGAAVGGHAYLTSLSAFLMGRGSPKRQKLENYPSPSFRIEIARFAAECAEVPNEDLSDPLLDAWDYHSNFDSRKGNSLMNQEIVRDVIERLVEIFGMDLEIPLANDGQWRVGLPKSADAEPKIDAKTLPILATLTAASKYRPVADAGVFTQWERRILKGLGLPSS